MANEFGPGAIRISQKYVAHANQLNKQVLYDTEQRTSIRRTTASKRVGIVLWVFLEFLGVIVFIAIILIEVASPRAQVRLQERVEG